MNKDEMSYHNEESNVKGSTIWIIAGAALFIRWLHLIIISRTDLVKIPIIDSAFYHQWATIISSGNIIGDRIFFMSPLYSYLVAVFYSILGNHPLIILFLQGIIGSLTVIQVYKLAKRLVNHQTGILAAISTAIYGPFIFYDSTLLTSSLIVFFSVLILNFSLDAIKNPRTSNLLKVGVLIGLSALTRPLILLYLPFLFLGILVHWRSTWIKNSVMICVGAAIILFPVGIRNLLVGHEFTLTTSSAGMNLYVGNNPDATGLYWEAPFLSSAEPWYEDEDYRRTASEAMERKLTTREAGKYWMGESLSWIVNHPGDYLSLVGRKILYFFNRVEFANNVSIYTGKHFSPLLKFNPFGFWIILPLGLAGLILMTIRFKWRRILVLWLWFAAYFLGGLLFFVSSEYRLPIVLILHIGAAFFILEIINRIRLKETEPILKVIALLLVFLPLANLRTPFITSGANARMDFFNFGSTLLKQDQPEKAISRFNTSLEIDPYFAEGMLRLAESYYRNGEIEKALEIGEKVGLENPEQILKIIKGNAIHEGYALLNEGNLTDAMKEFTAGGMKRAEAEAETTRIGRLNRARSVYSTGDLDSTISIFQSVRKDDKIPDPAISYNIAFLLLQAGRIDSAEFYAEESLEIDSMNINAGYLLAGIYEKTGRLEEAELLKRKVNPDIEKDKDLLISVRAEVDSLLANEDYHNALKAYAIFGKLGYDSEPQDKMRLATAQIESGNVELGLRLLKEAEEVMDYDPNLFYLQGRALLKLSRTTEAIEALRKAITVDFEFIPPRLELAEYHISIGELKKAEKLLNDVGHLDILDSRIRSRYNILTDSLKKL